MSPMDKKPKRPRDPSQLAKMMVDIASGDAQSKKGPRPAKAKPKAKKRKAK